MREFTVNPSKNQSAEKIASILNECNMLFKFDVENRVNRYILHLMTDKASVEYTETTKEKMEEFLILLKEKVCDKDNVNELLKEINRR